MKGRKPLLVISLIFSALVLSVSTDDSFEDTSMRLAFKVYNDCSAKDDFSGCLKIKAVTFLERLGRMQNLPLTEGVTIVKAANVADTTPNNITEEKLEQTLPRSADARDSTLDKLLMDKLGNFLASRSVEISLPRSLDTDFLGTGRLGSSGGKKGGGGGGGGGGGKKGGGGMGIIAALIGAKIYTVGALVIAGLFLLAKKALIIAKIALVISAIIGLKKLTSHSHGGHSVHHITAHAHHDDGWHGGHSGHGWDRRSAQEMAYGAYNPSV